MLSKAFALKPQTSTSFGLVPINDIKFFDCIDFSMISRVIIAGEDKECIKKTCV